MELKIIENIYELVVESWLIYGIQVWGVHKSGERNAIYGRFLDICLCLKMYSQ
jgi:hypothetical protein